MKVRTLKGRIFEVSGEDVVVAILLDSEACERIVDSPKELPKHEIFWAVELAPSSGVPVLRARCSHGAEDLVSGRIERYEFKHCGVITPIPQPILDEYNHGVRVEADGGQFDRVVGEPAGILK